MQVIQAENLTKYYGKARGIEGVNLSVGQGDIFGFIGPNGAGKSTFIRTVLGLIRPNSGKAEVLGLEAGKNQKEILKDIGYMPSESMFYDEMRVGEIISFSAKLRGRDCSVEAGRLCEQFALDARKKIGDLSLGNRKKV